MLFEPADPYTWQEAITEVTNFYLRTWNSKTMERENQQQGRDISVPPMLEQEGFSCKLSAFFFSDNWRYNVY